jgi:hypothetical protein
MVDRRRLRRLEKKAQKDGVVVQLLNGETKIFSQFSPFHLWALELEEGIEALKGDEPSEPTTPQGREALELREALENATPQSKAAFERDHYSWIKLGELLDPSQLSPNR